MHAEHLTAKLLTCIDLSDEDIRAAVESLMSEQWTDAQKLEFLEALARKGETAREIAAFALRLRDLAVPVQISDPNIESIDVCGTGADRAHTFNVSSTVMFIVAAAGIHVAKHGNRSITSQSGSADVLETLGVKIDLPAEAAARCLESLVSIMEMLLEYWEGR